MAKIGQGVGFAGLCFAAAWLEVSGYSATGLWVLVAIWVLWGEWGDK